MEHTPYRTYNTLSRWPLLYLKDAQQFFVVLHSPLPTPGRHWIPVIDVTDIANELRLNQGEIRDGAVIWGPGEAYCEVGSEGRYCWVHLKGDRRLKCSTLSLAVDITLPLEE
jgi:hypothetical protein